MNLDSARPVRKRAGIRWLALFGWAVFALLLVFVFLFGLKVFSYYRQIRGGELIELPQRRSALTVGRDSGAGLVAAPEEIEEMLNQENAPAYGPAADEAKLTVVMFGDFECPFSKRSATSFRRLSVHYGDRVRFVYLDFPLETLHSRARLAAVAAECAGEQRRYWEYFDRLYVNSPNLDRGDLFGYAREVGLDEVQFERCLDSGRFDAAVDGDLALAERLGLRGTPSFYVGGRRVEGAIPEDEFDSLLQKMTK